MKYGLITLRKDLPSEAKQLKSLEDCERFLTEPTAQQVDAVRPGQSLTVYSLKSFALERAPDYQPRKNALKVLEQLDQDGITVHVANTGRTYQMRQDSGQLSRDVLEAVAGVRQTVNERGRPGYPPPDPDHITEARAIWCDQVTYRTDTEAREALKSKCTYRWSNIRIRKYLGPSGRGPGRKKK